MEGRNTTACRKRKTRDNKRNGQQNDTYKLISFRKRSSSGRPGSPHRYFDDSYTVSLEGETDATSNNSAKNQLVDVQIIDPESSSSDRHEPTSAANRNEQVPANQHIKGNQIVHRHLNGICIVTAGTVLQRIAHNSGIENEAASVLSVKYHVNVSENAQSARGKLRAKKSKLKGNIISESPVHGFEIIHSGSVEPNDPLCTIMMSNGAEYIFKCCVSGTILELNRRLLNHTTSNDAYSNAMEQTERQPGAVTQNADNNASPGPVDPSLVVMDPLLDGYLAVILPRGPFPPKSF